MDGEETDVEQALLFMEAWGDGSQLVDKPFHGYKYAIEGYCPEHIVENLDEYFRERADLLVTVLANTLASKTPYDIEGYTVVYTYGAGEHECPGAQFEEHGADCPICQGDNFIYWGDEWTVYVLVPILVPERYEEEDRIEYTVGDGNILHREDGPALIFRSGREEWYRYGRLHRENGPATQSLMGEDLYYLEGTQYSPEKFLAEILSGVPIPIMSWAEADDILAGQSMQGELKPLFEKAVHDRVIVPRLTLWDHLEEG